MTLTDELRILFEKIKSSSNQAQIKLNNLDREAAKFLI